MLIKNFSVYMYICIHKCDKFTEVKSYVYAMYIIISLTSCLLNNVTKCNWKFNLDVISPCEKQLCLFLFNPDYVIALIDI